MRLFFILLTGIVLTGCVSQKETMVREGYPLAYAEGYDDGCHSGNKAGGSLFDEFKKDVRRFNTQADYGQGWSDGFRQCETQQEASQRQMRIAIEQQKLTEQRKQNQLDETYRLEKAALKDVDTSGLKNFGKDR